MSEREQTIKTYAWLAGWLCFACSWLAGAMAPTMAQAWNGYSFFFLGLTSLCGGVYGWSTAQAGQSTGEITAFVSVLGMLLPWFAFIIVMIAPYALGFPQG